MYHTAQHCPKTLIICMLCVSAIFIWAYPSSAEEQAALDIVASIAPLADMVYQVGGERVSVHQLIPGGASPHSYEPIPSDIVRLRQADAFFIIGLGLEFFIDRLVDGIETHTPVFPINQGIEIIDDHYHDDHHQYEHHHDDDHHHHHHHHHEQGNPHIWLSLRNAQIMVEQITGILSALDPEGSATYFKNSENYRQKLAELDQWFTEESEYFTSREFVASHAAWPYLARDYKLRQAGSIEQFPGREPTPREIQQLIDSIHHIGIRVVFAEPQLSRKAAEVLAEETGVQLAVLDPLGDFPGVTYLEIMRNNLENIAEVLR